jgi:hypothetical protein
MKHLTPGRLLGALLFCTAAAAFAQSPSGLPAAPTVGASNPGLRTGAATNAPESTGYVDLEGGLAYTDNAGLANRGAVSDEIAQAGISTNYEHQGPKLRLDSLGTIEGVHYLQHSAGSGSIYGRFTGTALWGQGSDPFQWTLSDGFGEGLTDPLSAPTLTNLEWTNYVTTGPSFNLNFGLRDRLTLTGLYARTTFQRSPYDSQGYNAGVTFTHALSGASSLSLQASTRHTQYLDSAVLATFPGAARSFDIRSASLGYNATFERTQFSAQAGYNTLNYGGPTHGSPLAMLQLKRQVSPFTSVFVQGQDAYEIFGSSLLAPPGGALASAGNGATATAPHWSIIPTLRQFAPPGEAGLPGGMPAFGNSFGGEAPLAGFGVTPGIATAAPFQLQTGGLGATFQRQRTSLSLVGSVLRENYRNQSLYDLTGETVTASWQRRLGVSTYLQLQGFHSWDHYTELHITMQQSAATLSLSHQLARLVLSGYARWSQQRSSATLATLPVASYTDTLIGVNASYDLIGQRLHAGP